MAIHQETITLSAKSKGFHLITREIEKVLVSMSSIETGLLHLFIKHTSASLSINENADPSVREDMENFFTDIADDKTYYIHTLGVGRYACTHQSFNAWKFTDHTNYKR